MEIDDRAGSTRSAAWIVLGVVALLLALSGRYGYHRDELYFIEAGERLAWGYVDQPPLTPLVASLTEPFGYALPALRLLPALSIGAIVWFAAAFAARFGGGSFARVLAALAAGLAPIFLAVGHLLATTTFDALIWVALAYLAVRIVQTDDQHWWLLFGIVVGIGLLNKWTILYLIGGLGLGLVLTEQRRVFRSPFLWAGAAIALAIWLPNLLWQAEHDWPFFEMARALHDEGVEDANSFLFVPLQFLLIGPVTAPIWIGGLRRLFRDPEVRPYRFLGWAFLILAVAFIAVSAKPYFLTPLYVPLLGAGAVAAERRLTDRRPAALRGVAIGGLVALPLVLPVLPAGTLADLPVINEINPELAETHGWESFVEQVAERFDTVPLDQRERATVFTGNYGEAGAIDRYRAGTDLPSGSSGHNSYWLWGPPNGAPVLIVGHFSPEYLDERFLELRMVGTIQNPAGLQNEEHGASVWIAAGPRGSWDENWPSLRHFN